jgi:Rrf2 family protein
LTIPSLTGIIVPVRQYKERTMSGILKISEASVLALHAMINIATKREEMATNAEIAEFLNASENHLSKVLQRLTKAGLVKSIRGPKGGFVLGKDSSEITIREIYELFEGPMASSKCLMQSPVCGNNCVFGDLLTRINHMVIDFMTETRLSDSVEKLGKGTFSR